MQTSSRATVIGLIVLALAALLASVIVRDARSADLLATWLAGYFFAAGDFSAIYAADERFYTMLPPVQWSDLMYGERGHTDVLFPFVYPPLWAWLASAFAGTTFDTIAAVVLPINAALLSATIFLAHRTLQSPVALPIYAVTALAALYCTGIGAQALHEGQPQILVGFLCVLTLERLRAGAPVAAGMALALAAAIKLYPALFVILLLAGRNYRAATSFAVFGGALAAASVALAGWPLHTEFLAVIRSVNSAFLLSERNFSANVLIVLHGGLDQAIPVTAPDLPDRTEIITYWYVIPKSPLWRVFSAGLPLLVALTLAAAFRSVGPEQRFTRLWPAALILIPFFGPIAWTNYFIAAAAFIPALLTFERIWLSVMTLGLLFAITIPFEAIYAWIMAGPVPIQLGGFIAVTLLALLFLARRGDG